MSKLPRDGNNNPIPVLGFRKNTGQILTITSTANTSAAFSSHVSVITLYSTEACFIELGDANVVANTSNSHFIPGATPYDISLNIQSISDITPRHISIVRASTDGIAYISERE